MRTRLSDEWGRAIDIYEALYTTRAMRRVRPDPIPIDVQARILDAAIRAPSGGNAQSWRFLLVDDAELRSAIAPIYRECVDRLWTTVYGSRIEAARDEPDAESSRPLVAMVASVEHAASHFAEYPLLLFAFQRGDPSGGSIFPAIWSAMLAARAEGIGTSLTTVLSFAGERVPELLRVPRDRGWSMQACVPMGYPTGRWGIAGREPVHQVTYRNEWGRAVGFEVHTPLWPGPTG